MITWLYSILIFLGITLGTIICSILLFFFLGFIVYIISSTIISYIEEGWYIDGFYCVLVGVLSIIAIVIIHDILASVGV